MFSPSQEEMIRKAAMAVAVSYMEHRDSDTAAKSAVRNAAPAWSQDRVDGFLKRQKERLKRPASEFRRALDSVVSEEKRQGGV